MKVNVIAPNLTIKADYVLYPYRVYHIRLRYRRLFGDDRVLEYFAYVDCIRLGVERGDGIFVEEWDVDESKIMKELIGEDVARTEAVKSAVMWGNARVLSWWYPKVEILRSLRAYKVFWVKDGYIFDSLSGEKFKLKS
ncbi:hypothetical protein [Archaeoglobus profundus]|uniref:Uncharacterized protein n=1 Tax=Archaeoglobus profundus (strain DSM 5631 / JCM 9629 / NBRC 100127 / Av18) TaxID=572546 RepID=D2RFF0_ARCPA|nr:hypothetical protein [Archaeoglobus profundus]ADB58844.1 hypothetical protein Arcpr_1800 [Archaeoglobus profundus DSM 5631]